MKINLSCPRCRMSLACDSSLAGKQVSCPKCKNVFTARAPQEEAVVDVLPADPQEDPILDVLPDDLPAGRLRPGFVFARSLGIDLDEPFEREVASEAAAARCLQEWKAAMPEVPSAYRPSGTLPAAALMLMSAATFLGVPAGVAAETVVGAIAVGVVALLLLLNGVILACGFIWCVAVVILVVVGLIALAAPFATGGWASAVTVTTLGRWGKNRNKTAAVWFSALSSGLSVIAFSFLFLAVAKDRVDALGLFNTKPGDLDIPYLVVAILGGIIAVVFAGFVAAEHVESAKFCEDCEQFMDKLDLRRLGLGGLKAITHALAEKKPDLAASLLHSPLGTDGKVVLFSCPHCTKGYIEVNVEFKVHWKEKKEKKEKEESWLCASLELAAADVERFQTPDSRR